MIRAKMIKKIFIFILVTSYLFLVSSSVVQGQHFISPSYIIDWGNFNITSGKKTSTNYSLTDTVGQNAAGAFTSASYKTQSGFQYIYNTFNKFSFSISKLNISLGALAAGVGSTDTNTLTISSPSGHGYQIMVQENHPLTQNVGLTLPDTKCDSNSCSSTVSGVWSTFTAYGFGFNVLGINNSGVVTGVGTSNLFTNATYFRSFPAASRSESSQIIMTESSPVSKHYGRVSYKALISSVQPSGNYQNSIIFTAVPLY